MIINSIVVKINVNSVVLLMVCFLFLFFLFNVLIVLKLRKFSVVIEIVVVMSSGVNYCELKKGWKESVIWLLFCIIRWIMSSMKIVRILSWIKISNLLNFVVCCILR